MLMNSDMEVIRRAGEENRIYSLLNKAPLCFVSAVNRPPGILARTHLGPLIARLDC